MSARRRGEMPDGAVPDGAVPDGASNDAASDAGHDADDALHSTRPLPQRPSRAPRWVRSPATRRRVGAALGGLCGLTASLFAALHLSAALGGTPALSVWWAALAWTFVATGLPLVLAETTPRAWRWLAYVGTGIAWLLVVLSPPLLSDDVWRYFFEGRLSASGIAPLLYPPTSPKVADLSAGLLTHINHPTMPGIYPPAAQAGFLAHAALGGALWTWKLMLLTALLSTCWLLARAGRPRAALALGLHPLPVIAGGGAGHLDVLGLPLLCGALLAIGAQRWWRAGAALGVAAGLKLFPLGLALAAALGLRSWRRIIPFGSAALVLCALYLPWWWSGMPSGGSLGTYSTQWTYSGVPFRLLVEALTLVLRGLGVPDAWPHPDDLWRALMVGRVDSEVVWLDRRELAQLVARIAAALGVAAGALWLAGRCQPVALLHGTLLLAFWLSPVVHPWYMVWLLPGALLLRDPVAWGWCATVVFAWWAPAASHDGLGWADPWWAGALAISGALMGAVVLARSEGTWLSGGTPS